MSATTTNGNGYRPEIITIGPLPPLDGGTANLYDRAYKVRRRIWSTAINLRHLLEQPSGDRTLQVFLQDVALDLMQVDDPRLYEMITTKEAIFEWEIKSGANGEELVVTLYMTGIKRQLIADLAQALLEMAEGNRPRDEDAFRKAQYLRKLSG
jgi:hypothetical protein